MKLIVGLGNPGKEYAHTRHNVGFAAVDALAEELGTSFKPEKKFQAEIADARLGDEKILLAKPTTFMNLSGEAVQALKSFYKLENRDILIVHDEMDFAPGDLQFSVNSGPAGHNGVESVQERLGTKDVARLRIGIGRPSVGTKEDFVLTKFDKEESKLVKDVLKKAPDALRMWIEQGLTKTMNVWNGVKGASS